MRYRLLIVDDDPLNLDALSRVLRHDYDLVRAADAEVTEADVIAWSRDRLAGYKCPTSVDWAEVLPRNPSGKILKKDLRSPYWGGRDRQV